MSSTLLVTTQHQETSRIGDPGQEEQTLSDTLQRAQGRLGSCWQKGGVWGDLDKAG